MIYFLNHVSLLSLITQQQKYKGIYFFKYVNVLIQINCIIAIICICLQALSELHPLIFYLKKYEVIIDTYYGEKPVIYGCKLVLQIVK